MQYDCSEVVQGSKKICQNCVFLLSTPLCEHETVKVTYQIDIYLRLRRQWKMAKRWSSSPFTFYPAALPYISPIDERNYVCAV
jgi:hypothetical protein